MRLSVTVKLHAKNEEVERIDERTVRVSVRALPREGKANARVIELLSDYFGIPKTMITLISGEKSKQKIIEIDVR